MDCNYKRKSKNETNFAGKIFLVISLLALCVLSGVQAVDGSDLFQAMVVAEHNFENNNSQGYDFKLTMLTPPAETTSTQESAQSMEFSFEGNDSQGWIPRGQGVQVRVVKEASQDGEYCLRTTSRSANWHGPSLNLKGIIKKGVVYEITGYVKLMKAPSTASMVKITMEQRPTGGSTGWKTVAQRAVEDTQWIKLSGQYVFSEDMEALLLYIESDKAGDAFYIDNITIKGFGTEEEGTIEEELPALCEVFADCFTIGAAVEPEQLTKTEGGLLKKHYNVIVAENVMKPDSIQPLEGIFNWSSADRIIKYAQEHKMEIRYHTLLWHQQVSDWFFRDEDGNDMTLETDAVKREANKRLLLERLEKHITAVVERYKDQVKYWDVVNEVIDPAAPNGLRNSKWFQITGTDYIETAFHTARKVGGPDIKLYINDYSTSDPSKRDHLYRFVRDLLAKGVPIDGVGHQAHINIEAPSVAALKESIKLFADLGLDNQLTELDVSVYTNNNQSYEQVPAELLVQQGYRYKELFEGLRELKDYISNVTFWGIADNHSWLHNRPIPRRDAPFPFDKGLKAKPAYWGMVDPSKLPVLTQKLNVFMGKKTIDGVEETAWKIAPWLKLGNENRLSATFKVAWDQRRIYVLADVKDATVNKDDLVEIFIDGNNAKTTSDQENHKHFILKRHGKRAQGTRYKVREYDGGYIIEAALSITGLTLDQQPGFDLRITDAVCAHGDGSPIISWNDLTHSQDQDTSKYGTMRLLDEMKLTTAIPGTPTIDAEIDSIWAKANAIATETAVQGTKDEAMAIVRTMWDEDYLYVLAEVIDAVLNNDGVQPHEQDSMEFFLDENNGRSITYEADDAQYRVNFVNEQTFGSNGPDSRFRSATRITADGYIVEAAIPFKTIKGEVGLVIGFDIQINDADADGRRRNVVTWYDPIGNDYRDTSYFGSLIFSEGDALSPADEIK